VSITAENDFVLATSTFSHTYQYQYPVQQDWIIAYSITNAILVAVLFKYSSCLCNNLHCFLQFSAADQEDN